MPKRQTLGAAPAKKRKFQSKRTIQRDEIVELEGNLSASQEDEKVDPRPEYHEDQENHQWREKASLVKVETLTLADLSGQQQRLNEKDFDWVDVEIENDSESPSSHLCSFKEDEYVVI